MPTPILAKVTVAGTGVSNCTECPFYIKAAEAREAAGLPYFGMCGASGKFITSTAAEQLPGSSFCPASEGTPVALPVERLKDAPFTGLNIAVLPMMDTTADEHTAKVLSRTTGPTEAPDSCKRCIFFQTKEEGTPGTPTGRYDFCQRKGTLIKPGTRAKTAEDCTVGVKGTPTTTKPERKLLPIYEAKPVAEVPAWGKPGGWTAPVDTAAWSKPDADPMSDIRAAERAIRDSTYSALKAWRAEEASAILIARRAAEGLPLSVESVEVTTEAGFPVTTHIVLTVRRDADPIIPHRIAVSLSEITMRGGMEYVVSVLRAELGKLVKFDFTVGFDFTLTHELLDAMPVGGKVRLPSAPSGYVYEKMPTGGWATTPPFSLGDPSKSPATYPTSAFPEGETWRYTPPTPTESDEPMTATYATVGATAPDLESETERIAREFLDGMPDFKLDPGLDTAGDAPDSESEDTETVHAAPADKATGLKPLPSRVNRTGVICLAGTYEMPYILPEGAIGVVSVRSTSKASQFVWLPRFDVAQFSAGAQLDIPDENPDAYFDHSDLLYKMAVAYLTDSVCALWGDAGVGKTEAVEHLARLTRQPFARISIKWSTLVDDVIGRYTLRDGDMHWIDGRFTIAWRQPYLVCVDEPNTGKDEVWQAFRAPFDGARQLVLDEKDGERIARHPYCRVFTAMNPSWDARFAGTRPLNDADLDRMQHIMVPYPPADVERKIIMAKAPAAVTSNEETVTQILNVARDVRAAVNAKTIRISFGLRKVLRWADAMEYLSPLQAFRQAVTSWMEPNEARTLEDVADAYFRS